MLCELVVRHSLIQGVGVSNRCPLRINGDAYFRFQVMDTLNHDAIAGKTLLFAPFLYLIIIIFFQLLKLKLRNF